MTHSIQKSVTCIYRVLFRYWPCCAHIMLFTDTVSNSGMHNSTSDTQVVVQYQHTCALSTIFEKIISKEVT